MLLKKACPVVRKEAIQALLCALLPDQEFVQLWDATHEILESSLTPVYRTLDIRDGVKRNKTSYNPDFEIILCRLSSADEIVKAKDGEEKDYYLKKLFRIGQSLNKSMWVDRTQKELSLIYQTAYCPRKGSKIYMYGERNV